MAVLSPSELSEEHEGRALEVGGRVLAAGRGRLLLGDAFALVEATSPPGAGPSPENGGLGEAVDGDLVVVSGRYRGGRLDEARLVRIDYTPRAIGFDPDIEGLYPPRHESRRFAELGGGHRLRARAAVIAAVRAFFAERGYLEVETPCLVPSPGLDVHLDAYAVEDAGYLSTSPEYQMKRLLAGGLPRIFQLARCFRRGEEGRRHEREFTMLEWYRAYASIEAMMDETEALVRAVITRFAPAAMPLAEGPCDLAAPFARLTVAEAFERFARVRPLEMLRLAIVDEERWFRLLVDQVEPAIATLGVPVFLHRFPIQQASLARSDPNDPKVAERFELYVGALELCNGFGELTDPLEQRGRFLADQARRGEEGKPVYPLDERFLAALTEGMPPAAGNALGLDRLVALALGAERLDEVIAFPAARL